MTSTPRKNIYLVATSILQTDSDVDVKVGIECIHAYTATTAEAGVVNLRVQQSVGCSPDSVLYISIDVDTSVLTQKLSYLGENDHDNRLKFISVAAILYVWRDGVERKGLFLKGYYDTNTSGALKQAEQDIAAEHAGEKPKLRNITVKVVGKTLLQSFFDEYAYIPHNIFSVDAVTLCQ